MLKIAATTIGSILLALAIWLGQSVSSNTITLAELAIKMDQLISTQRNGAEQVRELIEQTNDTHARNVERLDHHFSTIWPRLREVKERIQYLESQSTAPRAQDKWQY